MNKLSKVEQILFNLESPSKEFKLINEDFFKIN